MRVTPGRNPPRSAMWSASSITVISTASRVIRRWRIRSSRRPGQATTMSTPACSALTCLFCGTPPKMVVTFRPDASASGCSVAVIWVASSRVGASTRPEGREARRVVSASRLTRGMENASVLPLPVFPPRPSTSRPARVSGRVEIWIGKGWVMPLSDSARTNEGGRTPRSANVDSVFHEAFRAWRCGEIAGGQKSIAARLCAWRTDQLNSAPAGREVPVK